MGPRKPGKAAPHTPRPPGGRRAGHPPPSTVSIVVGCGVGVMVHHVPGQPQKRVDRMGEGSALNYCSLCPCSILPAVLCCAEGLGGGGGGGRSTGGRGGGGQGSFSRLGNTGGGGGPTPPTRPPWTHPRLKNWAKLLLRLRPIKKFLWRLRCQLVQTRNFFGASKNSAPLGGCGRGGGGGLDPPPPQRESWGGGV